VTLPFVCGYGMQAYKYKALMEMIQAGKLQPEKLIQKTISLDESLEALTNMDNFQSRGVTVIDKFS
jgi:alcohol dehydrogenase